MLAHSGTAKGSTQYAEPQDFANPAGAYGCVLASGILARPGGCYLVLSQFANPKVRYQLFVMLPYLASIPALVGLVGEPTPPAASGVPYRREAA